MKSRLPSLIGIVLCLWIAGAQALGVGEIELNSHLNQKLAAEIPLSGAEGLRADEILVSLGSSEDFERAGVERFFYLTDLRFEVFVDGRGSRIRITSRQAVTEPYLNFIVEVLWPNGRMLKEFTLLLDPPTYEAAVSRPEAGRAQDVVPAPAVAGPAPAAVAADSGVPRPSAYTRPERGAPPDAPAEGVPTNGQTLWGIAERYNPDAGISVSQYMLAIQRRNPDAFIKQNINLMKGGVRLQMPDAAAARELDARAAAAEVSRQTEVWRGGGDDTYSVASAPQTAAPEPELRAQMDATSPAAATATPDTTASSGILSIEGDTGAKGAAESPAANADVAALQEENARLQRQVQELGYQADRDKEIAASEIAVKDRQLEVKDEQLAQMRRQYEEAQAQLAQRDGQPSPDQSQPAQPWWQSTTVLIAAGLILVLALAGGLVLARRRSSSADTRPVTGFTPVPQRTEPVASVMAPAAAVGAATLATPHADTPEDDDTFDFLDDAPTDDPDVLSAAPEDDPEAGKSSPALHTSDVISEADIYAAYGRYPHAIGLLMGALDEDPERHDVRLKLLEVAVSANDTETFDKHIQELVDHCDDQDILLAARELEESFTGTQVERGTDNTAPAAAGDDPATDDLLDDDAFSIDFDEPAGTSRSDEDDFLLELDDEHDTGVSLAPSAEERSARQSLASGDYQSVATLDEPEASRADLLGGDLGIDFDDAELVEAAPPSATSSGAGQPSLDDDLDIDDLLADLDDAAPAAPVAAVPAASAAADSEIRFSRVTDERDVPLLDSGDALAVDDLLAEDDDDTGIEDLDELLADLDEVEERSAHVAGQPASLHKTAEILSFSRPRSDDPVQAAAFDDVEEAEDDGFDFGTAEDAAETKLDLAQAYIEMGDSEGAQDILNEVMAEGNPAQRQLAQSLLDNLAS